MSAHASQAFSIAHCTDSEDLPRYIAFIYYINRTELYTSFCIFMYYCVCSVVYFIVHAAFVRIKLTTTTMMMIKKKEKHKCTINESHCVVHVVHGLGLTSLIFSIETLGFMR